MPDWAPRCMLTLLHIFAALASGGCLVAVLLQWAQDLACLPQIKDGYGDPITVRNALVHACDVITYGSGAICGLSLFMAITVNCCWGTWCCSCLHQFLTLLICAVSVGNGAALTVDFLLWCNSLQNVVGSSTGCEDAAKGYDKGHRTANMTAYYRKMELQQGCQWAVVPIAFLTVVVYSMVMRKHAQPQGSAVQIRGRYYILHEEESAPLFQSNDSLPAFGGSASSPPPYWANTQSTETPTLANAGVTETHNQNRPTGTNPFETDS